MLHQQRKDRRGQTRPIEMEDGVLEVTLQSAEVQGAVKQVPPDVVHRARAALATLASKASQMPSPGSGSSAQGGST